MGNVIIDIIGEHVFRTDNALGLPKLDKLYDEARDRIWQEAERECIYLHRCLDHLSYFSQHEPEPSEVAEYLGTDDAGDWRKLVTVAATLTVDRALSVALDADQLKLDEAIAEAEAEGYEVSYIYTSCVHGWAPHASETTWATGTLHRWVKLEGGPDRFLLRVGLSGNSEVWLDLKPAE